ncbi:hypothetical protein [Glaciecola sp. 33A]|nr:hypothetical protein [Glaciecola sp. 33A]
MLAKSGKTVTAVESTAADVAKPGDAAKIKAKHQEQKYQLFNDRLKCYCY